MSQPKWQSSPPRGTNREVAATEPIMSLEQLARLQDETASVHVDTRVQQYVVELCERTRHDSMIALGVSPRGMLIWQRMAQSWALLAGRDFVTPKMYKLWLVRC